MASQSEREAATTTSHDDDDDDVGSGASQLLRRSHRTRLPAARAPTVEACQPQAISSQTTSNLIWRATLTHVTDHTQTQADKFAWAATPSNCSISVIFHATHNAISAAGYRLTASTDTLGGDTFARPLAHSCDQLAGWLADAAESISSSLACRMQFASARSFAVEESEVDSLAKRALLSAQSLWLKSQWRLWRTRTTNWAHTKRLLRCANTQLSRVIGAAN